MPDNIIAQPSAMAAKNTPIQEYNPQKTVDKLKESGLVGRGGAGFPTWLKWDMVKEAKSEKKYVICNASEGEPGIKKDHCILENYPDRVIDGMKIAINFLGANGGKIGRKNMKNALLKNCCGSPDQQLYRSPQTSSRRSGDQQPTARSVNGYIYLNPDYWKEFAPGLEKIIGEEPIELYKKKHEAGYVGGEETSAINALEGKRIEPRLRPPFPPTCGLWDCPTLINNVETFLAVSLIMAEEYQNKRFYTVNGDCLNAGVYYFPEDWTIEKILKETENYPRCDKQGKPKFDFFVQTGGDASGEVLNSRQLKRPAGGGGSITVYSAIKHQPLDLMKKWVDFFVHESCGQCTPCREGAYRIQEILNAKKPDWPMLAELLHNLDDTAFCGLGGAMPIPLKSYMTNVLAKMPDNKIKPQI